MGYFFRKFPSNGSIFEKIPLMGQKQCWHVCIKQCNENACFKAVYTHAHARTFLALVWLQYSQNFSLTPMIEGLEWGGH